MNETSIIANKIMIKHFNDNDKILRLEDDISMYFYC